MKSEQLQLLVGKRVWDHSPRRQNFIVAEVVKTAIIVNKRRQELLDGLIHSRSDLHTRLAYAFILTTSAIAMRVYMTLAEQPGYRNRYLHAIRLL